MSGGGWLYTPHMLSPQVRTYIYGIATALGPILIAYGLVDEQVWPLILAAVGAVLGTTTAFLNRPTKTDAA